MTVTQTYGANIAFIEELYEKWRMNPDSVSASWREFFADYEPPADEEERVAPPTPAAGAPAPRPIAVAAATKAAAESAAPHIAGTAVPLRGAASKIVQNMEASLAVPTATSVRNIPVKVLAEN